MSEMTPEKFYAIITKTALEFDEAERTGKPIPKDVENGQFAAAEQCANCQARIEPPKKPLRCSACKAVIYCSQKCSTAAWNTGAIPGAPGHKTFCSDNKRHMQHLPEAQEALKSFPWGRIEHDGTFSFDLVRGRFGVLGGTGAGFWSHKGGPVPHQDNGDEATQRALAAQASPLMRKLAAAFFHLDGHDLLHHAGHLSDEDGWRLAPALIPYRDLDSAPRDRRPMRVTEFTGGVTDWDSWYRWRRLPKRSPAALLMSFPLSVYHLVVDRLKLTSPAAASPGKRERLRIFLLGAEVELNFVPLFSELALLLPYHDVSVVMWGYGVHKLVQESKKQGVAGSPVRDAAGKHGLVFEYQAPEDLGAGAVSVYLKGEAQTWGRADLDKMLATGGNHPHPSPDVIIALNAGLGSYRSWYEVISIAHGVDIPFAVTEYLQQSLEFTVKYVFPMVITTPPKRNHDIAYNPFHRPGQRAFPSYKMPNLINGFSLVVVDKK